MAMLQFGGAMCNAVARFVPRTIWRINSQQFLALSSSAAVNPDAAQISNKPEDSSRRENTSSVTESQKKVRKTNKMVKEAFASMSTDKVSKPPAQLVQKSLGKEISTATSVNELLTIATNSDMSKQNALHVMHILSDWSHKKKINLSELDKDPRFVQLCQQLAGKDDAVDQYRQHDHGDLSMILGLSGDEEAAKLISTLPVHRMLKVISTLSRKRRRSTPILRSLSFNIARSMTKLDIKQSADLLYAMATLNFPDEVLLERVSADLIVSIPKNKGTAVVNSILTSLGFLRYKNQELLDLLCEWLIAEQRDLKPQHITSLLLTLATLGHIPANASALYKALIEPLKEDDLQTSEVWLDVVWATVVLGFVNPVQISSVLDPVYIKKLTDSQCLTVPRQVKLLNINAAAKLIVPNYEGPFLAENSDLAKTTMARSRQKQIYVCSVLDTLSNLFSSVNCLRSDIKTNMGFVLDAECYVDDKCNPLPFDKATQKHENAIRIGVIALDYSDFCRCKDEPIGIYLLMVKLLEAQGYKIITVPHTEYSPKDKLVTRVKYIEQKIKSTIIKPPDMYGRI